MIVSRTPLRITLGGGGTDLPSYYEKFGGFIFSFCLSKYMYICINRPSADNLVSSIYEQASIDYFSTTSLRITGGATNIDKVSAIKPRFTSSLQSSANIWTIAHLSLIHI